MFTQQAPSLANNLMHSGMPAQQASTVQNLMGQCRAPLVHRGPVKFDYTRQNMRQNNGGAGREVSPYKGGGPPPDQFPPEEEEQEEQGPPESGGPPGTPSQFAPPEDIWSWTNYWDSIRKKDVWVQGDRRRIEVDRQIHQNVVEYTVKPIGLAQREFVTDVFIDDDSLIVEKRNYFVWTRGESDPTTTTIAQFVSKTRVTNVYVEGNEIKQDKQDLKVLVLFPSDEESSPSTSTIIELTDCSTPPP